MAGDIEFVLIVEDDAAGIYRRMVVFDADAEISRLDNRPFRLEVMGLEIEVATVNSVDGLDVAFGVESALQGQCGMLWIDGELRQVRNGNGEARIKRAFLRVGEIVGDMIGAIDIDAVRPARHVDPFKRHRSPIAAEHKLDPINSIIRINDSIQVRGHTRLQPVVELFVRRRCGARHGRRGRSPGGDDLTRIDRKIHARNFDVLRGDAQRLYVSLETRAEFAPGEGKIAARVQ